MNESLAKFLDQAQLHAALGFVSACARAMLAPDTETNAGVFKKICIVIGSVALAVSVAYAVDSVETVRKWAPLAALASGILAQDMLMRINRRGKEFLDAAEDHVPGPKLSTRRDHRRDHDSDDSYYQ